MSNASVVRAKHPAQTLFMFYNIIYDYFSRSQQVIIFILIELISAFEKLANRTSWCRIISNCIQHHKVMNGTMIWNSGKRCVTLLGNLTNSKSLMIF